MLCPSCGREVAETDALCGSCGSSLTSAKSSSPESAKRPSRWSGKAIASLVLALLSFAALVELLDFARDGLSNRFLFGALVAGSLAALVAIFYGHMARASNRSGRVRTLILGKGVAIAGLVLGYMGLVVWFILTPPILVPERYRHQWGGSSAVGSLRTINIAAGIYASRYNRGFPPKLAVLEPAKVEDRNAILVPNEKAAGLIGEELASGIKAGYRITYTPGLPDNEGRILTYTVRADPVNPDPSWNMHYFTDQSEVIRQKSNTEADQSSSPIAG